jgi:hypothetical protein
MPRVAALLILCLVALSASATGSLANIPDPDLSEVPEFLTLTPASTGGEGIELVAFPLTVSVIGQGGPVANALVELEFSEAADKLITWCDGSTHPLVTGVSNANGDVTFVFYGGGCVTPGAFGGPTYIWQARANGIVLQEGAVNSPDAVDTRGRTVTQNNQNNAPANYVPNCDLIPPITGVPSATVGLSDAVYHTPAYSLSQPNECSKYLPPFQAGATLGDAQLFTPFAKEAGTCAATLVCP